MTSTHVPPIDLAPGMPSRVVTISATDITEGGQSLAGQMVRFALSDSLDVTSGGDVIAKTQAEVVLDSQGNGSIRLPVYDENVRTWCGQDWAILVTATWGSQKAIRVPAGSSSIALSALPPVRPLRGREKQWAITGASVTVTEGAEAGGTVTLSDGVLHFDLTVPPFDPEVARPLMGEVVDEHLVDFPQSRDLIAGDDPRAIRRGGLPGYAWAVTDRDGRVAGGISEDGQWDFGADPTVQGEPRAPYRASIDGEYAWAVVDQAGRAAIAVKRDGTVIAPSLVANDVAWSTDMSARVASDMAGMLRSDRTTFACIGDSMTYRPDGNGYPDQMRAMMPAGTTVENHGRAGYTADEILMQSGAIPLTVEFPGGEIAATGDTPVILHGAEDAGWASLGAYRTVYGSVAGVDGNLIRTDSNTEMLFRRGTDGSAVPVTSEPLIPAWGYDLESTIVAMMGRNDISGGVLGPHDTVPEHILAAYERLEGSMGPDIRHFLALSVTNRTTEPPGSAGYALVAETNTRLAERFGPRFLDIRTRLVRDGLSEAGLTPTPEDEAAMAQDCIPPQLMDDPTHWNGIAAGLIAGWVHDYLTSRDWIGS